jgi:hypothetical protein
MVVEVDTRRARNRAREGIKWVVRGAGRLTAPLRPMPDIVVIGAKRGGTTSLYFDLLEHPGVVRLYPPPVPGLKSEPTKGVHYFDSNFFRGETWYRSYFPTSAARAMTRRRTGIGPVAGEASPFYLFHPAAAARAHSVIPDSRIVVLLRDPVMRTYSHWKERRRNNAEDLDFLSALDAEPDRLAGERDRLLLDPAYVSYAWEQQSYATQSAYADPLRRWVDLYGEHAVHVAISEEYYADPRRVLSELHEFLGLPARPPSVASQRNAARGEDLDPGLQQKLAARFSDDNAALARLLGRDLPWR